MSLWVGSETIRHATVLPDCCSFTASPCSWSYNTGATIWKGEREGGGESSCCGADKAEKVAHRLKKKRLRHSSSGGRGGARRGGTVGITLTY